MYFNVSLQKLSAISHPDLRRFYTRASQLSGAREPVSLNSDCEEVILLVIVLLSS